MSIPCIVCETPEDCWNRDCRWVRQFGLGKVTPITPATVTEIGGDGAELGKVRELNAAHGKTDLMSVAARITTSARKGSLKCIAIACIYDDGDYGYLVTDGASRTAIMVSIALMQHALAMTQYSTETHNGSEPAA